MLSIGQPDSLWQNGTPQSMQRAPCVRSSTSAGAVKISRKSCTRSSGSRYGTAWRSNSLKPVGLPICVLATSLRDGDDLPNLRRLFFFQHAFVIDRHDLNKLL